MTITEQIADKYKDEPKGTSEIIETSAHASHNRIHKKITKSKLDACTQTSEQVIDMCFNALCLLNKGNSVFVLDDMHHTDREPQ